MPTWPTWSKSIAIHPIFPSTITKDKVDGFP